MTEIADFIDEIAPDDDMFRRGKPEHYYAVGREALKIVDEALAVAKVPPPSAILDLPSGYGRVLRMLKAAFPGASLTACDINRAAVDFCARVFGAEPVVADPRPDALSLPHSYDLIWCGSLLTHLPQQAFHGMLELFDRHLQPGGVLVFTTHGRTIVELLEADRVRFSIFPAGAARLQQRHAKTGFGFQPYPDSRDRSYGIALTSEAWVRRALERRRRLRLISYTDAAWDGAQDAVVCQADPLPSASDSGRR